MKTALCFLGLLVCGLIQNNAHGACATCGGGGGGNQGGDVGPDFSLSLGTTQYGQSAGDLTFSSSRPDISLFTPAALQYDSPTRTDVLVVTTNMAITTLATNIETDAVVTTNLVVYTNVVEIVTTNVQYVSTDTIFTNVIATPGNNIVIRQVLTPQILADVPMPPTANGYAVNFYYATNVGSQNSDGTYQVSGAPFITWLVTNSNPSMNFQLQVSEYGVNTTNYGLIKQWTYSYSTSTGGWVKQTLGGIQETMVTLNLATNIYQVIDTLQYSNGPVVQQVANTYQILNWSACTTVALVTNTVGTGASAKTTTYTYYDPAMFSAGPLNLPHTVMHPDGSWEYYNSYDSLGRATQVFSSLGDTTVDEWEYGREAVYTYGGVSGTSDDGTLNPYTPRQIVNYASDEVSCQNNLFPSEGVGLNIQVTTAGNLVTTNIYYTSGPNQFALQAVIRPDGTMTTYNYLTNGMYQTNITVTGQPDSTYSYIVDGMSNVTVLNFYGYLVSAASYDVLSQATLSADTYGNFDGFGRPQQVTHLDSTTESWQYACCGLDSTMDRDGVSTAYLYDFDRRQDGYEKYYNNGTGSPVTYENKLDAAGRSVQSLRQGTDGSIILFSQSAYDTAGRLILQTNALAGVTTYVETNDPVTGGLIRITTYPDLGTRIEAYYLDGTLKSVTGTAVHGKAYSYGTGRDDLGNTCSFTLETDLTNGIPSAEWIKTFTDMAGRTTEILYPGNFYYNGNRSISFNGPNNSSFYNNLGQLTNTIDPDGVSTIYAYNAKGELAYSVVDLNQDGNIDYGSDRITQTTNDVMFDSTYGTFVRRTRNYEWLDTQTTGTLVSATETSAAGLDTWQMQYLDNGSAVTTHSQTVPGTTRTMTNTAPDGSFTVNAYSYSRLVSSTRYDSNHAQIGGTSYGYDAQGRQNTITDARNRKTTLSFNNADLVVKSVTPNPGNGLPETTTTLYDSLLRPYSVTQPDGTTVSSIYLLTGELGLQFGSRTYPVGYGYDYAGRMQTMTNWSGFSTGSGPRMTTWIYDGQRGWLTNKVYADGTGPAYSYTPAGRLQSRTWMRSDTNGNPISTAYLYDTAGSLTNIYYSDGTPAVTNSYDRLGRLNSVVCNGMTETLTYNLANELLADSFSGGPLDGLSVTNGYDADLRRTLVSALAGGNQFQSASYGYDYASRLASVTDNNNNSANYSYLANSPLVSQIVFKQSSTTRMTTKKQYDYLNRLTQMSSAPSASSTLPLTFNYNYNPANQRTKDTLTDGSYWVYGYDSLGQVTNACKYFADGKPVAGEQFDYVFDTIGNRTKTLSGGDTNGLNLRVANYYANNLNQITNRDVPGTNDVVGVAWATNKVSVNGVTAFRKVEYFQGTVGTNNAGSPAWLTAIVTNGTGSSITGHVYVAQSPEQFSYDPDGNLTNDGRWAYTWDAENRLVQMTVNTNVGPQYQLTFGYDAKGRRIQKIVTTNGVTFTTNNFLYDGWNLVAELKPNNSLIRSYVWGTDLSGTSQGAGGVGGLLEISYYGSSTTNCFPAYDGNGNIMALVNAADGTVAANYDYAAFGEPIRTTGVMAKNNPFRFSTKYADDESDLLYYGYRYYKPSTGTWPNRDPKGELGFILLKDGWIKRYRSSSNHNYCPSCKNYANTNANMNIGDGNTFAFVNNDPLDNMDYLGLLSPSEALEAAWEAAKAGADYVGEEASLLEIFGGCGGLGVALAYAETQEQDCMGAAIMGPPSQDAAAEAACQKQWSGKIAMMQDIQNKECKCTVQPEKKHWWWPF